MKTISISMNDYLAKIIAYFFGWFAGLATLAHIKLPFLSWSWLPTVHASDIVIVMIGCFKAALMGGSSWVGVRGMQRGTRFLKRKWKYHKSKKNNHE